MENIKGQDGVAKSSNSHINRYTKRYVNTTEYNLTPHKIGHNVTINLKPDLVLECSIKTSYKNDFRLSSF